MLLPDGDLNSTEWWSTVSPTWGKWIDGKPLSVTSNRNGWTVEFEGHEAQVLPLDEDGHGKRLSNLSCGE
jgi:hypothetical protein